MSQTQASSLDKVQLEINRVLELLGRVFVAAKGQNRSGAIAATNKLKQMLPLCNNNFHNALDELDEQLQFAKLILRRDLALATQPKTVPMQPPIDTAQGEDDLAKAAVTKPTETGQGSADQIKLDDTSIDAKPEVDGLAREDVSAAGLKLDTNGSADNTNPTGEDNEKAPDTAFSNNADMDSLFNDPTSAAGDGTADSFNFDSADNGTADFDFTSFSNSIDTNNDALAMTDLTSAGAGNTDIDFSDLFGPGPAQDTSAQPLTQDSAQDFNFDDLMDLGISATDGANGTNNTTDFDMDFS